MQLVSIALQRANSQKLKAKVPLKGAFPRVRQMSEECQPEKLEPCEVLPYLCGQNAADGLQRNEKTSVMMKKQNFYVLGLGVLLIAVGMGLMSGSGTTEHRFALENFSARRIRLAPWLCMTGYATVGVAVFFEPRKR